MATVTGFLVLAVGLGFAAALAVRVARTGRSGGLTDRRSLVDGVVTAVAGLAAVWLLGPWGVVPAALWAVPVALTCYAMLRAVPLWRGLPWVAGRRRGLLLAGSTLNVAFCAAWIALVVA